MKEKVMNITKEEREAASIAVIKTLYKGNVPIADIEKLSGKNKKEIKEIINNLKIINK